MFKEENIADKANRIKFKDTMTKYPTYKKENDHKHLTQEQDTSSLNIKYVFILISRLYRYRYMPH